MRRLVNLLRGVVELTAQGPFPERLLNLCAQRRLEFWGLEWEDGHTMSLKIRRQDLKELRQLGERVGCAVTVRSGRGLPSFLGRFRKRYAFLAGLALSLSAVCVLSSFVLSIQVTGNQRVPAAQILGELRRLGLRPGVYGPGLELKQLSQEALLSLEELSWMTINLCGTRAEVIVREAVPPPKLDEEEGCYDVVAQADGLITHIEPLNGEALVQEDTVLAGEVLISGNVSMEPPMYSSLPVRYYQTHARGRVWAQTWRVITARIPLTAAVKHYTGEELTRRSLNFFGSRLDFYRNSSISWPFYDKITEVYPLTLPGGLETPIRWGVERCRAYSVQTEEVDRDAAQTLLEERLSLRLEQAIGAEGAVEEKQFAARVDDGWLEVTLTARCQEEIGREVPAQYGEP